MIAIDIGSYAIAAIILVECSVLEFRFGGSPLRYDDIHCVAVRQYSFEVAGKPLLGDLPTFVAYIGGTKFNCRCPRN